MLNDGWVKLNDPKTGKLFYANQNTRKTQWEAPPGFVDPDEVNTFNSTGKNPRASSYTSLMSSESNTNNLHNRSPMPSKSYEDAPLPQDWEMMHDQATGRPFYVNHVSKVTTWERPSQPYPVAGFANRNDGTNEASTSRDGNNGMATGFGFIPAARSSSSSVRSNNKTHLPNVGKFSSSSFNRKNPPPTASTRAMSSQKHTSLGSQHTPHNFINDDQSSKYYTSKDGNGLPHIDFTVVAVADQLRTECPSCDVIFSVPMKRRHHCRLCGDVFCDACSSHRVLLPLEGPSFQKPVRLCNMCHEDFQRGNYFSIRRYLTPLQLFNPEIDLRSKGKNKSDEGNCISPDNVSAALTAFSEDLDSLLLDPTSFSEKVTIPADVLVPAITRHLGLQSASERAIRALSNLLALGNVVGDNSFAHTVYTESEAILIFDNLFNLLEQSGSSVKTLAVQEQASRALFYLTDANVIKSLLVLQEDRVNRREIEETTTQAVESCDVHRSLRNMLDHATSSASPSLRRWAGACIRNLITEDHRRACDAVTEAMITENTKLKHESFISNLVASGGVMILSSLMGSEDGDTRAHATAALSAIITTARDMEVRLSIWKEAFGDLAQSETTCSDSVIIEAIVSSGACGLSLAQLLLSADDTVAEMGCLFASSLVHPILTIPHGSELPCYHRLLASGSGVMNNLDENEGDLRAYRKAALDLAMNDGILSALIQLVRIPLGGMSKKRPLELQRCAMDVLASIALTISYYNGKVRSAGKFIEGDPEWEELATKLHTITVEFEGELIGEVILTVYNSAALSSINTKRDSSASQLREASSLIMSATASFSPETATYLIANHAVTGLVSVAVDEGMAAESILRGDWANRRLAMMEAAAAILIAGWKVIQHDSSDNYYQSQRKSALLKQGNIEPIKWGHRDDNFANNNEELSTATSSLDLLLEALDAGIIPLVSHVIDSNIEYHEENKAYSTVRGKISCCHIIAALFGICQCDETSIGNARLYEAIEVSASNYGYQSIHGNVNHSNKHNSSNGQNMISSAVSQLQSIAHYLTQEQGQGKKLNLSKLMEANLLSLGSICAAPICSFSSRDNNPERDENSLLLSPSKKNNGNFIGQVQMASVSVCDVITKNSFLPSTLVGVMGEGCVIPVLRLAAAIAENGPESVHGELAQTGFLVPITDMLRDAVVAGDYSTFTSTVAVISSCGPHITASAGGNSNIQCIRACIQLLSNVLTIEESLEREENSALLALKSRCIFAIERLSTNSSLWSSIASTFVPCVSEYLFGNIDHNEEKLNLDNANICAALRAIQRVLSLPTNAAAVANTGIGTALCKLICIRKDVEGVESEIDCDVENLALQLLHTLAPHISAARDNEGEVPGLIYCGAVEAACCSLSKCSIGKTDTLSLKFSLEIFKDLIVELDNTAGSLREAHQTAFVRTVMGHSNFVKSLCATMLTRETERITTAEHKNDKPSVSNPIIEPIYGPPLELLQGEYRDFGSSFDAAVSILFSIATYCSLDDTALNTAFWDIFLQRQSRVISDSASKQVAVVAACAAFLNILTDENTGICVPKDSSKSEYYQTVCLPSVRGRLLDGLHIASIGIDSLSGNIAQEKSPLHYVVNHFSIPQVCLTMCTNPMNIDSAFQVVESLLSQFPDVTLLSICSEKHSLSVVFELLSIVLGNDCTTTTEMLKQFAVETLSLSAERNILAPSIKRFGLRSIAIASLSATAIADDQDTGECIEEDLAGSGFSIAAMCIRGLVGVLSSDENTDKGSLPNKRKIILSSGEANAISSILTKKLSEMILARFVKQAEVHNFEIGTDTDAKESLVTESPEVLLLCALASSKDALPNLCTYGGLDALSLVAAEGEISAISALHEASKGDPSSIINVEGHISVMQVIASAKEHPFLSDVGLACMNFLVTLCTETKLGRQSVSDAELCDSCIVFASDLLRDLVSKCQGRAINDKTNEGEKSESENMSTDERTQISHHNIVVEQLKMVLATISFLTAIVRIPTCREKLFLDDQLHEHFNYLALDGPFTLQHAVIKFFTTSARYMEKECTEEAYSISSLSSTLLSIIQSIHLGRNKLTFYETKKTVLNDINDFQDANQNLVHAAACSTIECILCYITPNHQSEILSALRPLFISLLDYVASPGKKLEKKLKNSGTLIFNITSIFVRLLGCAQNQTALLNLELLSSFVKFIIVNPPKVIQDQIAIEDKTYFDCALNQCLYCLSILMIEPCPDTNGHISWKEVISGAESSLMKNSRTNRFSKHSMVKRSASESTPFVASLTSFVHDVSDPSRSIASRKILERLEK